MTMKTKSIARLFHTLSAGSGDPAYKDWPPHVVGRVPSRGKQVVFEQSPSQEASQPSDARLQFPSWEGLGVGRFKDSPFPSRRLFVNSVFIII